MYKRIQTNMPIDSRCVDISYYELTRVPELSFKGMDSERQEKVKKYIINKIREINRQEKKYYEDIMDRVQYDYRYYFRYILEYSEYYDVVNSLSNFDISRAIRHYIPSYLSTTRLTQLKETSMKIKELLKELDDIRKKKLSELKRFSIKNKFYINCKIKPNT